jgi:hypothetical protein
MAVIFGPSRWHLDNRFPLGEPQSDGGNTICISGGIAWIVAPASSEVIRDWYSRNDAVTTATNCTSATGWFIPNCCQLKNPGYECRTYWDSYTTSNYWSNTQRDTHIVWNVNFGNGSDVFGYKTFNARARAFRCVIY